MQTPATDPSDLMGLIIAIITWVATKEIANMIGPHIAIGVAAIVAAGWSLSKAGELSGWQSCGFMLLRVATAIVFAVTLAQLIHLAAPWASPRVTAVPIAFIIGLIKDLDELREYKNSLMGWFRNRGSKDA